MVEALEKKQKKTLQKEKIDFIQRLTQRLFSNYVKKENWAKEHYRINITTGPFNIFKRLSRLI